MGLSYRPYHFLRLALLASLVILPIAELVVLLAVGTQLGVWTSVALIIISAVIGLIALQQEKFRSIDAARRALYQGYWPFAELFSGILLFFACLALIIPGFLSDIAGLFLLIPGWRRGLANWIVEFLRRQNIPIYSQTPPATTQPEEEITEDQADSARKTNSDSPSPPALQRYAQSEREELARQPRRRFAQRRPRRSRSK